MPTPPPITTTVPKFSISDGLPSGPTISRMLSPVSSELRRCGGLADRLHDDVDRAFFRVGAFDGERNTLAFFVDPDDDELPRTLLACDAGRFDDETLDSRGDKLGVDDFEHGELRRNPSCIVTWACDMGM